MFGLSVAEKFSKIDPNDDVAVTNLFQSAYKNILINPMMPRIGQKAKSLTTPEKYDLVRQFVEGGGGTLRLSGDKIVYASKQYQETGRQ